MNVLKKIEQLLPAEIEKKSFEIISEELSRRGIVLPEEEENITKRVIHTSADFEYTDTLTYSENSVQTAPFSMMLRERAYSWAPRICVYRLYCTKYQNATSR